MTPRRLLTPVFLVILFASAPGFAADRVQLSDGSVIFGTFKDADAGKVTFDTAFAGTLEIDQAEIVAMDVTSDLTLQMDDGEVFEAAGLTVADERLELEAPVPAGYSIEQLTRINPEPWELGNGYHWTGLGSLAFTSQRGNTELDELDYRLDSTWESLKDRYRLEAFGEVDEAQGQKNAENWTVRSRYDRIQTGDWYWGVGASLEQDLFADLDLRASAGPYLGRKFFTDPAFELEAEAGAGYVSEDFISADDREYIGATWDIKINSNYLGGDSRLYYTQKGILNLDELENLVLNNTLGVAFPLIYGLEGAAEVVWNINTGAVEGTEEIDETYRLRIGYSW
jgi:putative salt-induced outer membrane protein YdiY